MQPVNLSDAPENIKKTLIHEMDSWKRFNAQPQSAEAARASFEEMTIYSIRMYWQARFDKLNQESRDAFEWATYQFIPKHLDFKGVQPGQPVFSDEDTTALAKNMVNDLWQAYLATPEVIVPFAKEETKKTGFFSKIFKR
jgi:hypothetical protein